MSAYTVEELLSCEVSRHLEDGQMGFIEVGIRGTGGQAFIMAVGIPAVASRLAQLKHAPDFMVMFGSIIEPLLDAEYLPEATYDHDLIRWPCRAQIPVEDAFNIFKRGKVGVSFVSAAQIDVHGNLNIMSLDDYAAPEAHLPGALAQTDHNAHAKRTLVLMKHTLEGFVEKIDYVTGMGHALREDLEGARPALVFSDLAVMDFNPYTTKMRIRSVHPWSSVEEVQENTGYDLEVSSEVPTTAEPTEAELDVIRNRVDRDGKWLGARMSLVPAALVRG